MTDESVSHGYVILNEDVRAFFPCVVVVSVYKGSNINATSIISFCHVGSLLLD